MEQSRIKFCNFQPGDWKSEILKLQQSYQLRTVEVDLDGNIIELVKVTNIDDLLERANDPDEIPFWAELWPASIGLARFIFHNRPEFQGKKVLELGAGVGLAGIAAKLAGSKVVQSDFTVEALKFIQVNCLRNQVVCSDLLLADWRTFPAEASGFDVIIGADILYEKNLHRHLEKIFKESLQSDGIVLLADPGRIYAQDFMGKIEGEGWQIKQISIPVFYEERTYNIDIFRLEPMGNRADLISL